MGTIQRWNKVLTSKHWKMIQDQSSPEAKAVYDFGSMCNKHADPPTLALLQGALEDFWVANGGDIKIAKQINAAGD